MAELRSTESRPKVLDSVRARRGELGTTLANLQRAMDVARHATWGSEVGTALEQLREDFQIHVVLAEGPDGLHEQVLGDAPRLAGRVARLQREHIDLQLAINEALQVLEGRLSVESGSPRTMILGLLDRLEKHRSRGADLVYEAYQVDLGGAGD